MTSLFDSPMKVTHVAGGTIDYVRKLPYPHFSEFETPFVKGRRLEITSEETVDEYKLPFPTEFLSVAFAASRYHDKDNWDLYIDNVKICDSIYTKELPESVSMGNSFGIVYPVPPNTPIKFVFKTANPDWRQEGDELESTEKGDPKVVWFNVKFLRDENYEEEEVEE